MVIKIANIFTKVMDFFGRSKVAPELDRPTKPNESPKVSYAESPQLYIYEQFKLATDRISAIRDVQKLVKNDLRFTMTNLCFCSNNEYKLAGNRI